MQAAETHTTLRREPDELPPRYLRIQDDHLMPDLEPGDFVGLLPTEAYTQAGLYLLALAPRPALYICRSAGEGVIEVRQGRTAPILTVTSQQFRIVCLALAWGPLRREVGRSYAPKLMALPRRTERRSTTPTRRNVIATVLPLRAHARW